MKVNLGGGGVSESESRGGGVSESESRGGVVLCAISAKPRRDFSRQITMSL